MKKMKEGFIRCKNGYKNVFLVDFEYIVFKNKKKYYVTDDFDSLYCLDEDEYNLHFERFLKID